MSDIIDILSHADVPDDATETQRAGYEAYRERALARNEVPREFAPTPKQAIWCHKSPQQRRSIINKLEHQVGVHICTDEEKAENQRAHNAFNMQRGQKVHTAESDWDRAERQVANHQGETQ